MSKNNTAPSDGAPQGLPPLPETWADMTGDEKRQHFIDAISSTDGKPFLSPEIEEKYNQRMKRWLDAIALKEPDKVPKLILAGEFIYNNAGCKPVDSFYHQKKAMQACYKFYEEYDYDYSIMHLPPSGRALDILKYKLIRWPGSSLPTALADEVQFQYVEKEYMHADDYGQLIANPDGYLLRKFFPRIFDGLKGMQMLPTPYSVVEAAGITGFLMPFAQGSPLRKAYETLFEAADQIAADLSVFQQTALRILSHFGAPSVFGGETFVPFDLIGDTMRGTVATMLDMYRRPDDLVKACEALLPISVSMAVGTVMATRNPFVIIPLHKGAEGFMSDEQFAKFYWPTFRKMLLGLIDAGLIPVPFAEGGYTKRLDIIAESGLPEGKTIWLFDKTDMKAAKEKLGGIACIGGNVPGSLFYSGTPQMIEDYCKELMDTVAPGGGFILSTGSALDQVRPDNLRAFINFK